MEERNLSLNSSSGSVRVRLTSDLAGKLSDALRGASRREIGGILMGEHVSERVFLIKNLTIQRRGGTVATFIRAARNIVAPLKRFFVETKHDYTRFNYLGEWHSHPSYPPVPSSADCETMCAIVEDPEVGANFAVLVIVRLDGNGNLAGSATLFLPQRRIIGGELSLEL
jgi:proteasome lid subunit RPN8/RPN11